MRCVRIDRAGSWDKLKIVEVPSPSVGAGQVKVAVESIGVNFADVVVRMGLYQSAKDYVGWPITPGFEFAGIVSEVGDGVTNVVPGQKVFGVSRFGAYSSEVVVSESYTRPLPPDWSMDQGATFPVVFLTAWYALRELSRLRPGCRVLVHSAAGGVGGAALQIARACQAETVGIVGAPHKVELAKELGATFVIDKSAEPLWPAVERLVPSGFDVALDPNGVETLLESYKHLRPSGRLVVYGFSTMLSRGRGRPNYAKLAWDYWRTPRFDPVRMTGSNKSVMAFNLSYLFEEMRVFEEALTELFGWLGRGALKPLPVTTLRLDQVAEAHRLLESGTSTGKIALKP
jgi:NADPH:quinone reductase-like Zn-dependent oxidoreductase